MSGSKFANNRQKAAIAVLVQKLGLQGQKKILVLSHTDGRTDTSKDMYFHEANDLIKSLKDRDPDEAKAERMRRVIISFAHQSGYRFPNTNRVDMKRLDGWCVKYGKFHKKLNQHNYKELVELITQFKEVYKDHINNI